MVEFDDSTHAAKATQPVLPVPESDGSLTDEMVVAAIQQLRPNHREALLLSDLDGLPLSEISRRLGIPVGTAKSRIFRARRQARTKLREHAVAMGYLSDRRPVPALDRPRRIA
jgi:DNA-directed RNA polymerase specialized sigma24 family protein